MPGDIMALDPNINTLEKSKFAEVDGETAVRVTLVGGGGSSTLAGLTDVSLTGLANGDILQFNVSALKWVNVTTSSLTFAASQITTGTFDAARIPSLDASKITTGVFDIARIPAASLERVYVVADQTARYALTTAQVQNGDVVYQNDTTTHYFVVDDTNLSNSSGYQVMSAGTAAAVAWANVTSKPVEVTQAASGTTSGWLTSTDWTTFNGKEAAGTAAGIMSAHTSAYAHADIAHTNRAALDAVSGTNTGDVTITDTATIDLALTGQALSANFKHVLTADLDVAAYAIKTTTVNASIALYPNGSGGLKVGDTNTVSGNKASVLGGELNTASGGKSVVLNGESNTASGTFAVVGGAQNAASAQSCIALGQGCNVSGSYSFAAGDSHNVQGPFCAALGGGSRILDQGGSDPRGILAGGYGAYIDRRKNYSIVWANQSGSITDDESANFFLVDGTLHEVHIGRYINQANIASATNTLFLHTTNGSNQSNYIGLRAAANLTASTTYTFPVDGSAGYFLKTDGSGNLSWASLATPSVNYIDFATGLADPAYLAGRVYYDNANNALSVYSDIANTSLQIGQEQLIRVVNKTGSTLTDGSVVYVNGAQGNRPTVALADADLVAADSTIGVVTADILDNAEGYVTIQGIVRGYNTAAFAAGDALYVSQTAGQLTKVAPTHPAHDVRVGYALNSTANGSILISVHCGASLGNLHDVLINSVADKNLLQYESASGLWKNVTPASVIGTGYFILAGQAGGQVAYGSTLASENLTLSSTAHATKGKILFGSVAALDEVNGYLGIGTQSPTVAVDVQGTTAGQTQISSLRAAAAAGSAPIIALYRARGTVGTPTAVQSGDTLGTFQVNAYGSTAYSAGVGGRAGFAVVASETWTDAAHGTRFDLKSTTAGTTTLVTTASCLGANFGIGTTSPTEKLHVVGNAIISGDVTIDSSTLKVDSTNNRVGIGTATPSNILHIYNSTSTVPILVETGGAAANAALYLKYPSRMWSFAVRGDLSGAFALSDETAPAIRWVMDSAGYSGYGTTAPEAKIHVAELGTSATRGIVSQQTSGGTFPGLFIARKSRGTAVASPVAVSAGDFLGSYAFQGYDGSAWIDTAKINAIASGTIDSTRVGSDLAFYTGTDAAPTVVTERMRILANGNVGIGTSSAAAALDVRTSATSAAYLTSSGSGTAITNVGTLILANTDATTNNWAGIIFSDTAGGTSAGLMGVQFTDHTNNYGDFAFATRSAAGYTEKMRLTSVGFVGIGATSPTARLHLAGSISADAWGALGIGIRQQGATYTDTSSSGTVTNSIINSIGAATIAASNTTTFTNAATIYIAAAPAAGTNVTITNAYSIWVDAGKCRFDGDVEFDGSTAYLDSVNNRFGVGTNLPQSTLHVVGASLFQSSTQYTGFTVTNGTNTICSLVGFSATNDEGGLTLLSGGTNKIQLLANGPSYFRGGAVQFGSTTDYTEFETDGTLKMVGNATVWKDKNVGALGLRVGASAPTFAAFVSGVYGYRFDDAATNEVHGTIEIDHDYKEGTALSFHVHWAPTTTNTGNIRWGLEYSIASKDEAYPTSTTIYITQAGSGTVNQHQIIAFADISGTGVGITDVIAFRLFRDGTNGADTFTGNAFLLSCGIHYESDTLGSRQITTK